MYHSGFYQPFCHSGQPSRRSRSTRPTYVLSAEPVCRNNPSIFDLQQLVSHQRRQRRAAQLAAAQQEREREREYQYQREREYQRYLALKQQRERHAIEQQQRRRAFAVEQEKEAAISVYHHAQRRARSLAQQRAEQEQRREYEEAVNARRVRAQRDEEGTLAAFINSLFQDEPVAEDAAAEYSEEDVAAEAFEESSDEEEEVDDDRAVDINTLLNSLFRGMGVSAEANQTIVDNPSEKPEPSFTPSAEEPVVAPESADTVATQDDEGPTFADIQERYEQHQARVQRLEVLEALNTKLDGLASSFTFPSTLDFQSGSSTISDLTTIPALEYTPTNTPYHAHAHSLLALLVDADAVASEGDEQVRARRKEFVLRVENELDRLEREKARVWRAQVDDGR